MIIIKIFAIMGVVWFLCGFVCFQPIIYEIEGYYKPQGRVCTVATIQDVKYDKSSRNNDVITISYEINEKEYNVITISPKLYVKKGDKLKIAYKTEDYSDIKFLKLNIGNVILMIMLSLSCFGCGGRVIYESIVTMYEDMKEKKFKKNSKVVNANFVTLEKTNTRDYDGAPYYYIICEWYNKDDGVTYTFKSKKIESLLGDVIMKKNMKTFKVFIHNDDYRKYIISTDNLEKEALKMLEKRNKR